MKKRDRYANQYNAGGTRCTPDQVIRKVGWQEHNASSSSSNWEQADKGWKPSLRSTSYNWEPSASGSASWKDSPYNRELLASGGTGVIDYGDYSYDLSAWYDGRGYGTEADNSWCQEGEPDLHWPEAPPKPCCRFAASGADHYTKSKDLVVAVQEVEASPLPRKRETWYGVPSHLRKRWLQKLRKCTCVSRRNLYQTLGRISLAYQILVLQVTVFKS